MVKREVSKADQTGYTAPKIIKNKLPLIKIKNISSGLVKISASLEKFQEKETKKPHLKIYESKATDGTGFIRIVWFNKPTLKYRDFPGKYILLGKVQTRQNIKTLINPLFTTIAEYEKWLDKLGKR